MAKIKIVNRENLQTGAGVSAAQPLITPVSVIGTALSKAAEEFETKANQAFVSNEVTSRYAEYIKSDSDYTGERSADVNGFKELHSDWKKNSVELRNNAFKGLTDPNAQRILNEKITSYSSRQSISVQSHARKQSVTSARGKTIASLEVLKDQAISAKNADVAEILNTARQNLAVQVQAGIYTQEQGDILLKKINGEVQEERILQLIRTNPGGAVQILKAKNIPGISKGRHLSLSNMAKSMARQRQAVATQEIRQLQQDDLISIRKFGKGVPNLLDKIRRTQGESAANKYKKSQDLELKVYDGVSSIKEMTIPEINKFIESESKKLKPGKGITNQAKVFNEYVKAAKDRINLETKDPVKAINQSLLNEGDNNSVWINALTSVDKKAGEDLKMEVRNSKIKSIQKAKNVSSNNIRLLEVGEAKQIITAYNNTKSNDKVAFFKFIRERNGKSNEDYGIVLRDLVREGLPVEASLYSTYSKIPSGPTLAPILSNVLGMTKENYNKMEKQIPGPHRAEVKIQVGEYMTPYNNSLLAADPTGQKKSQYLALRSAMTKMVMFKVSLGEEPEEATKQVVAQTFDADKGGLYKYFFDESSVRTGSLKKVTANFKIRIPSKYDEDSVKQKAVIMSQISRLKEFKPIVPSAIKNIYQDNRKAGEYYRTILMRNGYWVTKTDDTGLWYVDGAGRAVFRENNGKIERYGFDFSEVQ